MKVLPPDHKPDSGSTYGQADAHEGITERQESLRRSLHRYDDIVEVFFDRLSGREDSCAIFLAVMRIPVVDIVLELRCELVDLVGLAGERRHVLHSGS